MNPTATPTPAPADAISSLSDFTDKLSPIVVKELRQGLRQPSFVILFLFLQSVLALAVISSLFAVSPNSLASRVAMGNTISGFFFSLFGLAVMVIQPMRALGALSTEIRDSTLDLLLLTKLDAWRIVYGKWLCLVMQSGLLLLAIVPYLMMRYFLGGMNLVAELSLLTLLFLVGAMICAGGIGASVIRSVILRTILALGGVAVFLILFQGVGALFIFSSLGGRGGFSSVSMDAKDWVCLITGLLLLIAFLTYNFLEFGATRIAPPSENRSTRKRLIAIASLIVIPILFTLLNENDEQILTYVCLLLIAPFTMADSLSENPQYFQNPRLHLIPPFLRPGWPSGSIFCLLMLVITCLWLVVLTLMDGTGDTDQMRFNQGIATFILIIAQPAMLIALFRPRLVDPANLYLTTMLGALALGMVLLMFAATVDSHEQVAYVLFPVFPVLGFATLEDPSTTKCIVLMVTAAVYLSGAAIIGHEKWKPASALAKP